jgi:hypothetical protein
LIGLTPLRSVLTRQFVAFVGDKAVEDEVGGIVGAIPGLLRFV